MKVGFGCDHVAVELKQTLMEHLKEKGYECVDYGAYDPNVKVNYPEPGLRVAEAIMRGEVEKGVLICGTGIGISLAANKVPGIRAAVCSEPYSAKLTVEHNNANIIAMGARVVGPELAKMIVDEFFGAEFQGGRHAVRVDMISHLGRVLHMLEQRTFPYTARNIAELVEHVGLDAVLKVAEVCHFGDARIGERALYGEAVGIVDRDTRALGGAERDRKSVV